MVSGQALGGRVLHAGPRVQSLHAALEGCGCIILPTSQPMLLYLVAEPHKTLCVSHPLPGCAFPCLSGKVPVSSSLENYQVPAATWEEGELALKESGRSPENSGACPPRVPGCI